MKIAYNYPEISEQSSRLFKYITYTYSVQSKVHKESTLLDNNRANSI